MKRHLFVLGISFLTYLLYLNQPVEGTLENIMYFGPPNSNNPCNCGKPNIKTRIVGGTETLAYIYPWVGQLHYCLKLQCGLTLINDRYALTAAHCVDGLLPILMKVVFVQNHRELLNIEMQMRLVSKVTIHPNYSRTITEIYNDIALLRLSSPIEFTDIIRPVCLPSQRISFAGQYGMIAGWGALTEGGPLSPTLQEVVLPIIDYGECQESYPASDITEDMFCAGYTIGQKDACAGDSGGALHVIQNNEYQIAGIVSWGQGCARPNSPGVYTRVGGYLDWIKASTKDTWYY